MKKKYIIIGIVIIVLLRLVSCNSGNKEETENKNSENTQNVVVEETVVDEPAEKVIDTENGVRDETLEGRGNSDIGRSEPEYVGIIGYVALEKGYNTSDYTLIEEWTVPTYQQDKQFWVENGTIEHKTEVLVKEQLLEHRSHGWYKGYLLVERTDTKEQVYINVKDFITNPYWLNDDLIEAVRYGDLIAEFNQVSDYYPVKSNGNKAEIENGASVLIVDDTGMSTKKVNADTNQLEVIVLSGKSKGTKALVNKDDLTVIY